MIKRSMPSSASTGAIDCFECLVEDLGLLGDLAVMQACPGCPAFA
jgi:hypothetical protein